MQRRVIRWIAAILGVLLAAPLMAVAAEKSAAHKEGGQTYKQDEVLKEAEAFFGKGAEGLGKIIAKAFKEHGEPNGFIKGEEAGGAIGVGVRYGKGTLQLRSGTTRPVYWQGPSIGFDLGGNAAKEFVLVYHLDNPEVLFQRFPGVEGSLYFVGGVGLRYLRSGDVTLAPVQLGVGWRQGANVGYMHFTRKKSWNPF
jgi:hypothetical protein